MDSIIFVCSGNVCRFPMAKYIMRNLIAEKGLSDKIIVDSADCNAYRGGFMSINAQKVLKRNNIPFDQHASKPFIYQDYKKFKYVIALDRDMLQEAKEISYGD